MRGMPATRSTPTILRALAVGTGVAVVLAGLGWLGHAWWASRLPGTYNVMDYGTHEYGGGPVPPRHAEHQRGAISVADLHGPQEGAPDARFVLTAQKARIRLASGRTIDALTFNGSAPGPELRVHEGDLVQVTLRNRDVRAGVTIHWHGVNVPNAEDGVAGVTQNSVPPGGSYVYRFRPKQVGTFWYHTHQSASDEVGRGLFGALVIEPRGATTRPGLDLALVAHEFDGVMALNADDELARRAVAAGTPVRFRLINSDNTPQRFTVAGTSFRVVAIDGTDVNGPSLLVDKTLRVAGGGRYDIAFTMPRRPVGIAIRDTTAAMVLSVDGKAGLPAAAAATDFDPAGYGAAAPTPFDASSRFDRSFRFEIGQKPGFFDGRPGRQWTINGGIYPDVPVFVVQRGDLVRVSIVNKSNGVHPMHLHGHHMLVLSRGGRPVSGSPWWTDTLDVDPGERYDVAFLADNPGLWMDHCHNLQHAAEGLTMHVAYAGVATPFLTGGDAHNHPE
jgi:FtsP/CotA-like multicopper oxidase with cupredoxin domain